jgi:hypothetical protein
MIWPEPVSPLSPCTFLASPKSVTRGLPLRSKDIGWFQVTMNDSALVGIFDGLTHAADQLGGAAGWEWSLGQALEEALSLDESHRKIMLALMLGPKGRARLFRHVIQIVVDARLAPRSAVGLEPAAHLINAAGQVDIEVAEVEIRSLTHRFARDWCRTFRGI